MEDIRKALTEMHRRLHLVEAGVKRLNAEVAEGHARTGAILERLDGHWATVQAKMDATHAEALGMRQHAEEMRKHAEEMRRHAEEMAVYAHESAGQAEAVREEGVAMRLEGARNAAAFDQVSAEMAENLQAYQKNVGIVLEFVVSKAARHDEEHEDLYRRIEALEQRFAG